MIEFYHALGFVVLVLHGRQAGCEKRLACGEHLEVVRIRRVLHEQFCVLHGDGELLHLCLVEEDALAGCLPLREGVVDFIACIEQ